MNTKNDIKVTIKKKTFTLSGYESSEYLQKVADYINSKHAECAKQEGYGHLDNEMKNILLEINISDDYFKAHKSLEEMQQQKEEIEKEIFDMKLQLVSLQEERKNLKKELKDSKKGLEDAEKNIIRLETELKQENNPEKKNTVSTASKDVRPGDRNKR